MQKRQGVSEVLPSPPPSPPREPTLIRVDPAYASLAVQIAEQAAESKARYAVARLDTEQHLRRLEQEMHQAQTDLSSYISALRAAQQIHPDWAYDLQRGGFLRP